MKAQYTCPKSGVKGKICTWISAGDLVKVKKNSALASARLEIAEQMLREVHDTCRLLGQGDMSKVLTTFDVQVVHFLLDKQNLLAVEHKTLYSIGHAFVQELHVVR